VLIFSSIPSTRYYRSCNFPRPLASSPVSARCADKKCLVKAELVPFGVKGERVSELAMGSRCARSPSREWCLKGGATNTPTQKPQGVPPTRARLFCDQLGQTLWMLLNISPVLLQSPDGLILHFSCLSDRLVPFYPLNARFQVLSFFSVPLLRPSHRIELV